MNTPIDTDSVVLTEDVADQAPSKDPEKGVPVAPHSVLGSQTILPEIDTESIKFDDMSPGLLGGPDAKISTAPPQPSVFDNIRTLFRGAEIPAGKSWLTMTKEEKLAGLDQQAFDKHQAYRNIFRESPEEGVARAQNTYAISKITGVPAEDISRHYHDLLKMSAVTGMEADPTPMEILEKTMTAGVVVGAVADPFTTIPAVLTFMALDKLVPVDQFMTEDMSPSARDGIKFAHMVALGGLTGGILHMTPKFAKPMPTGAQFVESPVESALRVKTNITNAFKSFMGEKLRAKNLPTVALVSPTQLAEIVKINKPEQPLTPLQQARQQIAAAQKGMVDASVAKQEAAVAKGVETKINNISEDLFNGRIPKNRTASVQHVYEATKRTIDRLDKIDETGKLTVRQQKIRTKLQKSVEKDVETESQVDDIITALGLDQRTVDTAIGSNSNVKISLVNLTDVAALGKDKLDRVQKILAPDKVVEGELFQDPKDFNLSHMNEISKSTFKSESEAIYDQYKLGTITLEQAKIKVADLLATQKPVEIPEFKNTNEALAFGKSVAGNKDVIATLKAKSEALQPAIDAAKASGDFQGGMNLSYKAQLYREAREAIENPEKFAQGPKAKGGPSTFKAESEVMQGLMDKHGIKGVTIVLAEFIKTPTGEKVAGSYIPSEKLAKFIKNPLDTTGYHESFHALVRLSGYVKELESAIQETMKSKKMTHLQAEEHLGDLFAEYASAKDKTKVKGITAKMKALFDKALKFIEKKIGQHKELFDELLNPDKQAPAKPAKAAKVAPEVKPSAGAQTTESLAVEAGFADAFEGMPGYETINKMDQAIKSTELVKKEPRRMMRIAMGRELPLPTDGVLPESVMIAVRNKALEEGNVEALRDIATVGNLSHQESVMGQRLSMLAENDTADPVGAMRGLKNAREEVVKKQLKRKGTTIEKESAKLENSARREVARSAARASDWLAYIKSLECV